MNVIETLYYCRACHYIFPAAVLPERCPDCGKDVLDGDSAVWSANEKEIAEYEKNLKMNKRKALCEKRRSHLDLAFPTEG